MKAYAIRPRLDIFDGTGVLSPEAVRAVGIIAEIVADCLQQGGDTSHQAMVWEGPHSAGTPPDVLPLAERERMIFVVRRLLDPNDRLGGDIRSALNCRAATFGDDGQAILCLRHEDAPPVSRDSELVAVREELEWLAETDILDGAWPEAT